MLNRFTFFTCLGLILVAVPAIAQDQPPSAKVTKGDLTLEVNLPGVFVADDKDEIKIEPRKYRGELIVTEILAEGVSVKKDDVLMEFDGDKLDEAIEEAQNGVSDAEVQLKKANAEHETARIDRQAKLAELDQELAFLQRDVSAAVAQQALEMEKKEKQIVSSQQQLAYLKVDFETLKKLYAERDLQVSNSGDVLIEREEKKIANSEKAIVLQQKELQYFKAFDMSKAQLEKELLVEKKQAEIKKQGITLEAVVIEKKSGVDKAQRKLDSANRTLEGLKQDREELRVRSPRDGVLLYGTTGNELPAGIVLTTSGPDSRSQLRIGGRVATHSVLLTVATMDRLSVKMRVLENDIQHIQQDLPITVHPDAYPKIQFAGKLTKVDQIATKTGISPTEARRFTVLGKCTEDAPQLRSGMNCRVTIHPHAVSNAILVPIVSVFEEKSKYYCYVQANSTWERREVEVGLSNENTAQIVEGLQEGDEVLLRKPDKG